MKKIISAIIVLTILTSIFTYTTCTASDITVTVDGTAVSFDVRPQIVDGRTLVPLRKIFEEIGALVKWDGDTQTVTARKSSKTVTLAINSNEMIIDKGKTDEAGNAITETVTLDVPAQIIYERTLVPVRAISESFGLEVDWDSIASEVSIKSNSDEDNSWKENKETINLSDLSENQLFITKGGDYTLSGTLTGSVTVNTEEKVKLRLAGVTITSDSTPCIYVENADKSYIELEDGSENTLQTNTCESGTIYSKDNLEIKGSGTLNIISDTGNGIKSSDNLTIEGGNINITAKNDGIHVNDTLKIKNGSMKTETSGDGIDSESIVNISGGKIDIKTTLEPTNADELNNEGTQEGFRNPFDETDAEFESSSKGIKADWMMVVSGGEITVNSTDHAIHCASDIEITGGEFTLDSKYGKGISGHGNVTIDGKDTVINVQNSTEGLESKNVITINNGTIRIIASDDGINGGGTQGMDFGAPRDNKGEKQGGGRNPFENGDMIPPSDFTPPEDKNFENMQPPSDMNFMPDDKGRQSLKDVLIINGGDIEVTAGDDCLDANGNMVLNGGIVKASEPNGTISGFTSVFDPDGTITINKKITLIAAAGSGSAPSFDMSQPTITLYTDDAHNTGETITLKDSSGKRLAEYSPAGGYRTVWIALPDLTLGESYTVTAGNESHTVSAEEQNTVIGTAQTGFGSFGGGRGPKKAQ